MELDGGGGADGEVLDEEAARGEVGKHPEEAVALGDLLGGWRGEELRAAGRRLRARLLYGVDDTDEAPSPAEFALGLKAIADQVAS